MVRGLKLVAVVLILMFLSAPLFAAVPCRMPSLSVMHCQPGCPMMASMASAVSAEQIVAQHPGPSCCDISNGKLSPVTILQAPGTIAFVASPAGSATVGHVPAAVCAHREQPKQVRVLDSSQSLLCTFLI
jgi:hypothetical protein